MRKSGAEQDAEDDGNCNFEGIEALTSGEGGIAGKEIVGGIVDAGSGNELEDSGNQIDGNGYLTPDGDGSCEQGKEEGCDEGCGDIT